MFIKVISTILSFVLMTSFASVPNIELSTAEASLSYISEADATELANQCISTQLNSKETTWNTSTAIHETVRFYDPLGTVNAYLFRIKTEQEKDGYIFVDAYSEFPHVQAFGYDCNFMIDEAYQKNYNEKVKTEHEIVYNNDLSFLKKEDNGKYKLVLADDYIETKESDIKAQYKKEKQRIKAEKKGLSIEPAKSNIARLSDADNVQPLAQVVYTDKHMAGVTWNGSFNFVPFVQSDFTNVSHCAPTAATNLVYYWSCIRPGGHKPLWNGRENALRPENTVFSMLYCGMRTDYTNGTYNNAIIPGLRAFARARYDDVAGSDFQTNVSWSFITSHIIASIPMIVTLGGDPIYKNHAFLCVGYQECSDGNFLRIADGWSRTISNFYYFKGSISGAYCVWW